MRSAGTLTLPSIVSDSSAEYSVVFDSSAKYSAVPPRPTGSESTNDAKSDDRYKIVKAPEGTKISNACIFLACRGPDGCKLLVTEEKNGKWGIPGGRAEEQDGGSPWKTAKREMKEETGVDLDAISHEHYFHHDVQHKNGSWTRIYVIVSESTPTVSCDGKEIVSCAYIPITNKKEGLDWRPGFINALISIKKEFMRRTSGK